MKEKIVAETCRSENADFANTVTAVTGRLFMMGSSTYRHLCICSHYHVFASLCQGLYALAPQQKASSA